MSVEIRNILSSNLASETSYQAKIELLQKQHEVAARQLIEDSERLKSELYAAAQLNSLLQQKSAEAAVPVQIEQPRKESSYHSLQNEIYRLQLEAQSADRELFNERSQSKLQDLKWKEIESRNAVLQQNCLLLEKELQGLRIKHETLVHSQSKYDLDHQNVVIQLQSELSQKRETILNLQLAQRQSETLQREISHISSLYEKTREENSVLSRKLAAAESATVQQPIQSAQDLLLSSDPIFERFAKIEESINKLCSRQSGLHLKDSSVFSPQSPNSEQLDAKFSKLAKKMRSRFQREVGGAVRHLEDLFHERQEVDRQRAINEKLLRSSYEKTIR
ncbi:hypothetical protein HDU91_003547, partial [Kappamyces sp. JEL0680]